MIHIRKSTSTASTGALGAMPVIPLHEGCLCTVWAAPRKHHEDMDLWPVSDTGRYLGSGSLGCHGEVGSAAQATKPVVHRPRVRYISGGDGSPHVRRNLSVFHERGLPPVEGPAFDWAHVPSILR